MTAPTPIPAGVPQRRSVATSAMTSPKKPALVAFLIPHVCTLCGGDFFPRVSGVRRCGSCGEA